MRHEEIDMGWLRLKQISPQGLRLFLVVNHDFRDALCVRPMHKMWVLIVELSCVCNLPNERERERLIYLDLETCSMCEILTTWNYYRCFYDEKAINSVLID